MKLNDRPGRANLDMPSGDPQGSTEGKVVRSFLSSNFEPVPGYRLTRFLGRGGWGEVWKARHETGEPIAMKFLPCDSPLAASQEIRALQNVRQLAHPSILTTHQIWSIPGYVVVGMELAEGSLLDLLDVYYSEFESPIFPEHVCHYLSQVAAALDFMNARQHRLGDHPHTLAVRHCDVKPSNLLIRGKEVKVADFSLAVPTASSWCPHRRVGTLAYAAPEIFQGMLSDRTDQYALAITYHQLRTGFLPFKENPTKFCRKYVRPTPDLSRLSPQEEHVIRKSLDPVPQNRWPTCTIMMEKLGSCFATETPAAC